MINKSRTHRADGTPRAKSPRRGEVRRLTSGINDLLTLFPKIAAELVDEDPSQLTKGSLKKYSWKCPLGHVYISSVAHRTRGGGCGVCSGSQILLGVNDLSSRFPEIALEADGWDPTTVSFGSNKKVKWKCKSGHKWIASINNRSSKKHQCPLCSGRIPIVGINDLSTTHPEIALEADGWDPTTVSFGSNKKVKWKCKNGHKWSQKVIQRQVSECPTCHIRHKSIAVGKNDLLTTNPEIAAQADGWDPTTITAGSGKKFKWKCSQGHVWIASVGKRTSKDPRNCPICSNQKILVGYNDLKTTHPEIAKAAVGWDTEKEVAGTNRKKLWKCKFGHEYISSVNSVVNGAECLVCSNLVVQKGVNDLSTTDPKIALQANGWDPTSVHIGSHKKMAWKCQLGHEWFAQIKSRKANGCPVCGNRVVVSGFNDLASVFPELAREADGWDPTKFAFATTKKMKWKCLEGHKWSSTIKNRSQLKRGCPSCATSGFDPNIDGWLYLLEHPVWEMQQIGITNDPKKRIATHTNLGWEIIELRGPLPGDVARVWETEILRALKKSGASFTTELERGKFTGFTEAWMKISYPVKSISYLMKLVEEYEDNILVRQKTKK
jgi:hypothetical protein